MAELSEAADKAGAATRLAEAAAEDVVEVAKPYLGWMWGGFAMGLGVGLGGGFLAARKYLEPKYEKMAEEEIDQMREHFRKRAAVREDKPDLSKLTKKVEDLGYRDSTPSPPGEPNVQQAPVAAGEVSDPIRNVFESSKDASEGWDYEVEKALREDSRIYIIHRDEYGDTDNTEATLTYYAGDDILCDSNDHIVDNQARLVGNCLDRFGHGSDDRNTVYVRNEELDLDLEVIKFNKTYAEEVHGFKHEEPSRRRIPKRRPERDSR